MRSKLLKSLAALIAISMLIGTVFADTKKSPAAFLEFKDGSGDIVSDSSGKGNTGKIMSSEACQWAREDDRGFFLVVDNKSNSDKAHVKIEDSTSLSLSGPFTIIIYFSCDLGACEKKFPFANLLTKGNDYNDGVSIMLAQNGDTLVNLKGLAPEYQTYVTGIKSGAENVLAVVYSGSDVKVYVNGKLSGTTAVTGKLAVAKSPVYIGNFPHLRYKFKGNLYTVKIYSEALNGAELKDAFKVNLKGVAASANLPVEKKWPKPGEIADKQGTVYFNDFDKLEPQSMVSQNGDPGQWHLRRNVNFMAHGPHVLHTPAGYFPEPDLFFSPSLTGKYDILAGMRIVNYKTMLQIKTDSMNDYATIEPPVSENHENIEILAFENVDMTGRKVLLHPCGPNAYIGYIKFIPAGSLGANEKSQYLKAKTESARTKERYQKDLMADSDFRERIYVEEKKNVGADGGSKITGIYCLPGELAETCFSCHRP